MTAPARKMYLRHLIERGYGWEDIVVKCRSIRKLRDIPPAAIKRMVLESTSASEGAPSEADLQLETVLRPTRY